MTSELTLMVLRLGFLAVLWIFVFSIIYALRSDLFGTRASEYQRRVEAQSRQQTFAASDGSAAPAASPPAPQPVAAPAPVPAPSGPSASSDAPTTMTPHQAPAGAGGHGAPPASGGHERTARLHVTSGPKRGTEVLLRGDPVTIGRAPDSDLVVQDDYTSTHHARIMNQQGRWMIHDLDSTNGTYVGGRRVTQPTPLQPGTPVRIGTTTFELR